MKPSPGGKAPRPAAASENRHKQELWLAVHLPRLALEVIASGAHSGVQVVVTGTNHGQYIHIASRTAEQLGIVRGMSLSAACALCPALQVLQLDPAARQRRLQGLANWALQFSPRVSLDPPCSLLLEVRGSRRYFGDLDTIQKQVSIALRDRWKHDFCLAISPTPAASTLLARSGNQVVVDNMAALRSALGNLSIKHLPLTAKQQGQLAKTGVRVLRDLWRLPAAALARRFGPGLIHYLDQVLGRQPQPLPHCQAPLRFELARDLPCGIDNYRLLLPYAYALLETLADFLKEHEVYTDNLIFHLQHEQRMPTIIHIGLRRPVHDAQHFMLLLETKIDRMSLTSPVLEIKLLAGTLHAFTATMPDLFCTREVREQGIASLLEQLHARLGYDVITGISSHADHRPEYASGNSDPGHSATTQIINPRPLWLLPSPRQLRKKHKRLYYKSRIRFSMGPERIESGWWDGAGIQRDYYIGIDEVAGSLWIYNDLKDKQLWYLHGLFG